jgi:hypothetical protein
MWVWVWGGDEGGNGYSVFVSKGIHFAVQGFPSIHGAVELVGVSFDPFSCPLKWRRFNEVPDGVDDVEWLVWRIWYEPGVENQEGGSIIAMNVDRTFCDVVDDTDDVYEDDDPEYSREFASVWVSFLEWSWDSVNACDLSDFGWSHEGESSGSF